MRIEASNLLLLLNWMSPTFPIGSFAYSHGLEQAIADDTVKTAADVEQWMSDLLQSGSAWNDAVLFAQCWIGGTDGLNDLAFALCGSAERYQETTQLGRNFNKAANVWLEQASPEGDLAYPIAAGKACAHAGIERELALLAFLQGFAAAQISVAIKLALFGQRQGLEILRNLSSTLAEVAAQAQAAKLDDLGGNCLMAEVAAMKHETLEPRIYRT